jgi:hypothetical protein
MDAQCEDHGRRLGAIIGNLIARANLHRKPLRLGRTQHYRISARDQAPKRFRSSTKRLADLATTSVSGWRHHPIANALATSSVGTRRRDDLDRDLHREMIRRGPDPCRLIYDPASPHSFPNNEVQRVRFAIISLVRQVSKLKDWANGAFAFNADIAPTSWPAMFEQERYCRASPGAGECLSERARNNSPVEPVSVVVPRRDQARALADRDVDHTRIDRLQDRLLP